MEPEKSSIGESSVRMSSKPEIAAAPPKEASPAVRARHASLPTSQSKDSVCSARRLGTSSGSRIFANVVRGGDPAIPNDVAWMELGIPERETAKMRPSKDYDPTVCTCSARTCRAAKTCGAENHATLRTTNRPLTGLRLAEGSAKLQLSDSGHDKQATDRPGICTRGPFHKSVPRPDTVVKHFRGFWLSRAA
jgi:hypothetical protein